MNLTTTTRTLALLTISIGLSISGHAQNQKFQLIPGPFSSWTAAKADAESRGGHLATFTSAQEWQQFTNLHGTTVRSNPNPWWLGASDAQAEGVWEWVTGEAWSFSVWALGEPSGTGVNGKEDYLTLSPDLTWNDAAISIQFPIGYVLEYEPDVALTKAVKPSFANLSLGANYQLQVSEDLNNWTNYGAAFTATNTSMVYPQYWDVENWGSLFFRLRTTP